MDSFWEFFWLTVWIFAFVAYLMVLFTIITDLFRDHEMSGWLKALWLVLLFVFPFLSALVYVITRGQSMTKRSMAAAQHARQQQESYIRDVAGKSSTEQISEAKALLDSGAITADEFSALKAKALGGSGS
ncbi:SHOCT domain-containing protein [Nocardia sp. NPDC050710]|uniref:SHOCT domain-containing protein n=1 Tax=Nocardia sp. NPDC050710 TaxID=3157220 RepID=UPI0033F03F45